MKISILQMCSSTDVAANIAKIEEEISAAGLAGSKMLFAPEMSACVEQDANKLKGIATDKNNDLFLKACQRAAKTSHIWVHLGSIQMWKDGQRDKLVNRSFVIDDEGKIRGHYDKIHLFDVSLSTGEFWRESDIYLPGNELKIVETPLGKMGLSICYDLRFPELFGKIARSGATVFAVPAAFTETTGLAHWHVLLRARAIETASYVIAAAQSGKHQDGRETFGHSLVVDPWGRIILDMKEKIGRAEVEVDLSKVRDVRWQIPVIENYRELVDVVLS